MRLLIFLGIIYLGFRLVKNFINPNTSAQKSVQNQAVREIDDIMIKDPLCETYFPRRNGVHLKADGKDLLFCSKECRDKFVAMRSQK